MAHIPKAICMNTEGHTDGLACEMYPKKHGFRVEMMADKGFHSYYKIMTDLYECLDCGTQTIVGFASQPFTMQHNPGYNDVKTDMKARFRE